jgi:hypothetical protein
VSHGSSLQIPIPISLVSAVCSQSSFACGISHFISDFSSIWNSIWSSNLPPGGYCGYLHWWSGCCVTAEGVFSTFRSFSAYLIREVDTDVPTPTLKFSVGWGWVCNRMY